MKKKLCCLLTVVLFLFSISSAFAAGYTLPFKMQRQLEVGSGLKGSFVIHSNASAEKEPLIHALANAESAVSFPPGPNTIFAVICLGTNRFSFPILTLLSIPG